MSSTPGPWEVGTDRRGVTRVFADNCEIVRALSEHGPRRLKEDERAANRHLIAAAPDLLEALRDAEAVIHHLAVARNDREVLVTIRLAIAKAEGRDI